MTVGSRGPHDAARRPRAGAIADAVATGVGLVGVAFGTVLTLAPDTGGRWLRLGSTSIRRRRALGVVDLALGTTTLRARDRRGRWLPVAAHAVMHVPFARVYRRDGRPLGAAIMWVLLGFDATVAAAMRRRGIGG